MAQEPVKQIDVWMLTGYLGSGKTTVLNAMLTGSYFAGKKTALVINEFGKMGIDGQLVKPGDYQKYEINKGSIFCVCTKTDFIRIFQEIGQQRPDVVIIEATGVAETSDIEQFLYDSTLASGFQIRANLCIVDGQYFIQTAAFLKAAVAQVKWADGLIVNKYDLITEQGLTELRQVLTELNPTARQVVTEFGKVEADFLKSLTHQRQEGELCECPPQNIPSIYMMSDAIVDRQLFFQTLETLKDRILRLKGDVCFKESSAFVEIAGGQINEQPAKGTFEAKTAFTVIGWKIEKQQLMEAFQQTLYMEITQGN